MSDYDYELIAISCEWFITSKGWQHSNAFDMHGWWCAFRRFDTAKEAIMFQRGEID